MTTPEINPIAAQGFGAGADAYERARPTYPAAAVAALVDRLDLRPGRTVLDLGAGTGKMTRLLAATGARVLALEPVEGMRAHLREAVPGAELVDGTAEAIGLPNGSVDAVVAAQAFHWFTAVRALSEIHRVLRPGGILALAWNFRDESVPWVARLGELLHPLAAATPQARTHAWRRALARDGLFEPFETRTFHHAHRLDEAGLRERVASVSFVAAADPAVRDALLDEVGRLAREEAGMADDGTLDLPYETELVWSVRRSPAPGRAGMVAVVALNAGGVPKPPVDAASVGGLGLDGDGHTEPDDIHGGPDRAVCLYSQEAIERVRADGHQAFPGAYGENLVLLGIDWATLAAGDRLAFGAPDEGLLLELTWPATPCQTIAHWFVNRRISRISAKVNPQDARWYARVLRPGPVAPSMPVRVLDA